MPACCAVCSTSRCPCGRRGLRAQAPRFSRITQGKRKGTCLWQVPFLRISASETSLRARLTSGASIVGTSLLLCFFHRLARFFGALGTEFRTLLALLVNHLLGAQQF